jgi:hypothetical protein
MNDVTNINTAAAQNSPASEEVEVESPPKDAVNMGTHKMAEVTSFLLEQMGIGEVCRFGTGWVFRCPKCKEFIFTDEQYKTFSVSERDFYRVSPSVCCPHDDCDWHQYIVVEPEFEVEIEEEGETNEAKAEDNTQPTVEA